MGHLRASLCGILLSLSIAQVASAESSLHPGSAHLVDLTADHWCHDCVVKVIDKYSVMNGFQDHTFRGDWTVNRYELAAAVVKTYTQLKQIYDLELPDSDDPQREIDVLPDHWAYHYVRKLAQENGLLNMMFYNGKYEGDKTLTRKELAYSMGEFLGQMEEAMGHSLNTGSDRRHSELAVDHDLRSDYYPYVEKALNHYQFMNLHADHTFRPDAPVTRYDMAAAVCRVFELFALEE